MYTVNNTKSTSTKKPSKRSHTVRAKSVPVYDYGSLTTRKRDAVPNIQRAKTKRRATKRDGVQRNSSVKKKSCSSKKKKGASEKKENHDTALPRMSTWKSDDYHKRRKGLKKAHEKQSYRYDEPLVSFRPNDRANALFSILNDLEDTIAKDKEGTKKKVKIEKGTSLPDDELTEVEQDAIDILGNAFDSKKRGFEESAEIENSFHMMMGYGDSDDEVHLNSDGDVKMNQQAVAESSESTGGLYIV